MKKVMTVLSLVLCFGILAARVSADDSKKQTMDQGELSAAFEATRKVVAAAAPELKARTSSDKVRILGFVPENCMVESWCLVKATKCFVGRVTNPTGLYQAHSQYSVVRRVTALCRDHYDRLQRVVLTGPVEPVKFKSDIETTKEKAVSEALRLCKVYRQDWVGAAPVCKEPAK